jgi:uroporphyrinogen decarboxylase
MNSFERIFASLKGKVPDRVPNFELFIDKVVIDSIKPGLSYEDFVEYADLDVVTCLAMTESPDRMDWIDREKGFWRDKWGCVQGYTGETMSVPMGPPRITCLEDLATYVPPDPLKNEVIETLRGLVRRFKGKKAVCVVGEDVFAVPQYLRAGLEELMVDFALNPELAKKLANIGREYHIELYRKLIDEGADLIALGDDYAWKAGPMMSPSHFEEFVLPGLTDVVREIHRNGAYCVKHTDGDLWKLMDMIVSTGVDMVGPLESPYMDLEVMRKRYPGTGVIGNVNVDLLIRGSADEVRAETRRLLRTVSVHGKHWMASANSISSWVKGENFMAMIDEANRNGSYPIRADLG